jgi:carboxyl-terminal processing protease
MQSGVAGQFVFQQIDRDRSAFARLSFDALMAKLDATDQYVNAFQQYVSGNGMRVNFMRNKPLVKRYLNAEFARQLFGEDKYYAIALKGDPMIEEVSGKNQ